MVRLVKTSFGLENMVTKQLTRFPKLILLGNRSAIGQKQHPHNEELSCLLSITPIIQILLLFNFFSLGRLMWLGLVV